MITTTVMRRVLAKLEAATLQGPFKTRRAARLQVIRLLQGNDGVLADLARALNAETPAFTPNGPGASSTACDDQHTTARRL